MRKITAEQAVSIGGQPWRTDTMSRVYFRQWPEFVGLRKLKRTGTKLSQEPLWGIEVPTDMAARIVMTVKKVWVDAATGRVHIKIENNLLLPGDPAPSDITSVIARGLTNEINRLT